MKILGIIFLFLAAIVAGLYFFIRYKMANIEDKRDLAASIDKQAGRHLAEGKAYGLVVGVYKNGKAYIKGYGTAEKGKDTPPDSTTVFELASTSKLFTTATLQLLADEGVLKPDDKIQAILGNKIKLPAIAEKTTLRHLATHTSGFPSLPRSFIAKMSDETNPYKDLVTEDIYGYLETCEEKKEEGAFAYSNFGMGLLGHLLELKTGICYEQLVKERLLNPLGMGQTFVTVDSTSSSKIIQGFDENGNPSPVWTDKVLTGAGSFLSSGSDMMKFVKANLDKNASAISGSLLATHEPQPNGETGLGWILPSNVDRLWGNKDIVWHNGMAGAYASFVAIDKVNNYGLFILSNKSVDVTNLGMRLAVFARTQSWKE